MKKFLMLAMVLMMSSSYILSAKDSKDDEVDIDFQSENNIPAHFISL